MPTPSSAARVIERLATTGPVCLLLAPLATSPRREVGGGESERGGQTAGGGAQPHDSPCHGGGAVRGARSRCLSPLAPPPPCQASSERAMRGTPGCCHRGADPPSGSPSGFSWYYLAKLSRSLMAGRTRCGPGATRRGARSRLRASWRRLEGEEGGGPATDPGQSARQLRASSRRRRPGGGSPVCLWAKGGSHRVRATDAVSGLQGTDILPPARSPP